MKHILKRKPPQSFIDWKRRNPTANWNIFSGTSEYHELRDELVKQQNKMCCYCEVALAKAHIEHFKDRANYPSFEFCFENLLGSCNYTDSCGHKKDNKYFDNMISPLNRNCHSRFTYTRNGKIIPCNENDHTAQKTITILGLNCKRLKDNRRSIIKTLENQENSYIEACLKQCIEWYNGFYSVIEYVLNNN